MWNQYQFGRNLYLLQSVCEKKGNMRVRKGMGVCAFIPSPHRVCLSCSTARGYWSPSSTAVFSSLCLPTVVQEAIDFAAAATNGTTSGDTGTLSTSARTAAFSQTNTVACARDRSAASGAAIAPERRQRGGDGGGGHSFNDEEQGVPVTWAFDDAKAADRDTRIATTKCHVQGTAGRGDFTNPPSSSGAGVREVTGGMVKRKSSRGHSLFQKGATVQVKA